MTLFVFSNKFTFSRLTTAFRQRNNVVHQRNQPQNRKYSAAYPCKAAFTNFQHRPRYKFSS